MCAGYRRMDAVEYLRAFTDEQLAMLCAQYDRRINSLGAENKQLRELVRDMFSYAFNREMELCNACVEANGEYADCAACDEYDGACGIAKQRFEDLYADRMRELGVDL